MLLYACSKPGIAKDFKKLNKQPGDLAVGAILGSVEIVKCTGMASGEPAQTEEAAGAKKAAAARVVQPVLTRAGPD